MLVLYLFEKVNKGRLKMINVCLEKWSGLATLSFNKIIKGPGNSFSLQQ